MEALFKICEVLNISVNNIYGVYANLQSEEFLPYEKEAIYNLRLLNADGKDYIKKQISFALSQDSFLLCNSGHIPSIGQTTGEEPMVRTFRAASSANHIEQK